jgi:nitroreductase
MMIANCKRRASRHGHNSFHEAAMRRLRPDPVPDELINKILQAAQWAPRRGNTQRWRFLLVEDPRDQEEGAGLL